MTLEVIKDEISRRTGIPAHLLTGNTLDENIEQAKALLSFKLEYSENNDPAASEPSAPKSAREQFAEWASNAFQPNAVILDFASIFAQPSETAPMLDPSNGYPKLQDNGEPTNGTGIDLRSSMQKFEDWAIETGIKLPPYGW